jgi:probable F420-dependent oxidoreductase
VKPFRFGAKATRADSAKEWGDLARRAEDLGYSSFQIDDHFGGQLAALPAAMAAAAHTTSIKVGPLVAGNDFRNPVLLAKEAATIDLLSEGRFVLGVGAGWLKQDYQMSGIAQDDAHTRIERLSEAIQIFRGIWSGESFSFSGAHYEVAETTGYPVPGEGIPILVGGGGKEILSVAARQADIVGINPKIVGRSINPRSMATTATEVVDQKLAWVREAAGDRFDSLELQLQVFVTIVTEDPVAVAEKLGPGVGLPPQVVLDAPYFQIGSISQIRDRLVELRERWGINYIAFQPDATEAMAPVVSELAGT